jgi:hypothetical protein
MTLNGQAMARNKAKLEKAPTTNTSVEVQKPLDLSVPFKVTTDDKQVELQPDTAATKKQTDLFVIKPKTDDAPLQLKGHVFLTPDQETEKRKSFDGAGIVINLKQ